MTESDVQKRERIQKAWDREERERQKELESQERLILKAIEAEASQFDSIAEARKRKRREEAEKEKEVTRAERARRRNEYHYLHLPLRDDADENLSKYKKQVLDFYDNALKEDSDAKILVHCREGLSRSVAILTIIEMEREGLLIKDVFERISLHWRPALHEGFDKQLEEMEKKLFNIPVSSIHKERDEREGRVDEDVLVELGTLSDPLARRRMIRSNNDRSKMSERRFDAERKDDSKVDNEVKEKGGKVETVDETKNKHEDDKAKESITDEASENVDNEKKSEEKKDSFTDECSRETDKKAQERGVDCALKEDVQNKNEDRNDKMQNKCEVTALKTTNASLTDKNDEKEDISKQKRSANVEYLDQIVSSDDEDAEGRSRKKRRKAKKKALKHGTEDEKKLSPNSLRILEKAKKVQKNVPPSVEERRREKLIKSIKEKQRKEREKFDRKWRKLEMMRVESGDQAQVSAHQNPETESSSAPDSASHLAVPNDTTQSNSVGESSPETLPASQSTSDAAVRERRGAEFMTALAETRAARAHARHDREAVALEKKFRSELEAAEPKRVKTALDAWLVKKK